MIKARVPSESLLVARLWRIANATFFNLQHIYIENQHEGEAPFFLLGFVEGVPEPTIAMTSSRDGARLSLKKYPLNIQEIRSRFGKVFVYYGSDQVNEYRNFDAFIEAIGIED